MKMITCLLTGSFAMALAVIVGETAIRQHFWLTAGISLAVVLGLLGVAFGLGGFYWMVEIIKRKAR